MITAAVVCAICALVVLVEIESWRRRTVASLRQAERRRAVRERAWERIADDDVVRPAA